MVTGIATAVPASVATVLIVDDEPQVRTLLTEILANRGLGLETAPDGVAAIEAVATRHPDVVLLDVDMPKLRGVETLAAIKAVSPATRVIMISGKADFDEARRALVSGAYDYIMKPFDLAYLDQVIRFALIGDD